MKGWGREEKVEKEKDRNKEKREDKKGKIFNGKQR